MPVFCEPSDLDASALSALSERDGVSDAGDRRDASARARGVDVRWPQGFRCFRAQLARETLDSLPEFELGRARHAARLFERIAVARDGKRKLWAVSSRHDGRDAVVARFAEVVLYTAGTRIDDDSCRRPASCGPGR